MVQAVLDALSAPQGGGDLRTRPQRYHDALAEAMRRLLASNLLPQRARQPVKALVHVSFADLCDLDADSALLDKWITEYRVRWAAARAAASVATGDGGAWLDGNKARAIACDAMLIPVVTGDVDHGAVEELILLCVQYHRLRVQATASSGTSEPAGPPKAAYSDTTPDPADARDGTVIPAGLAGRAARPDELTALAAEVLTGLEQQIIAKVLQVVSGARWGRVLPAPPVARQGPGRAVAASGRRADQRHPRAPAPAGRPAGPGLPVPRQILPLNTHYSVTRWSSSPSLGLCGALAVSSRICRALKVDPRCTARTALPPRRRYGSRIRHERGRRIPAGLPRPWPRH
jgi:Domain of unknown function (DUF222)